MLTEADRSTLARAGITDIDSLAAAAAAFLRAHPIHETAPVTNALSHAEEIFLRDAYPLAQAAAAHAQVETGHGRGKSVLLIGG